MRREDRIAEIAGRDVLRDEVDAALEVVGDHLLHTLHAIGELPVAGHHVDTQQLAGLDHVLRVRPQRGGRALPAVAAVEQQRARAIALQPLDQRGQVGEAAQLAVAARGGLEVQRREREGLPAARNQPGGLE